MKEGFEVPRLQEDVRLAFSKLLPASILWDKKKGYSERKSGLALAWDSQLARFVNVAAPAKPFSKNPYKKDAEV